MSGGGFTEAVRFTVQKYREHLKLIEQDQKRAGQFAIVPHKEI